MIEQLHHKEGFSINYKHAATNYHKQISNKSYEALHRVGCGK